MTDPSTTPAAEIPHTNNDASGEVRALHDPRPRKNGCGCTRRLAPATAAHGACRARTLTLRWRAGERDAGRLVNGGAQ
jgi:hypothetical protein